ncbi:hypothetical protein [Paenibacillus sp. N3.4]|uniref:hypothetical protein n=1 Tax=Paenibacillus sp. N3.4 TaxID=2603222 RepID=UPI0028FCAD4F|nr:hypothetical protein [Paenibacillus sp. N3.4]
MILRPLLYPDFRTYTHIRGDRLEEPDSGRIVIGDKVITDLNKKELREARRKIGMIFQQFNLLDARTVFQNVAFPL